MASCILPGMDVQMVDEQIPLDPVSAGQDADELVTSVVHTVDQIRVQLDSVTRLQHGVLGDRGALPRVRAESTDTFAQLDRSGPMAEAEADEAVHSRETLYLDPEADPDRMRPCGYSGSTSAERSPTPSW
jgi:hypothetical protein